jgi:hypothetical protein
MIEVAPVLMHCAVYCGERIFWHILGMPVVTSAV